MEEDGGGCLFWVEEKKEEEDCMPVDVMKNVPSGFEGKGVVKRRER